MRSGPVSGGIGGEDPGLGALVPLLALRLRNRARRFLARLRDPRYALAFLAGLAYFGWLLFGTAGAGRSVADVNREFLDGTRGIAPFGLAVLVGFWWLWGGFQRALSFTPAEVGLLFPAPFRRSTLLRYKLLKLQGGLGVTALLLSLVVGGGLPWPARFVSWWILVTTLHLHQLGSSLVRTTATRRGWSGLRRSWIPLLLLGLAAGGLSAALASAVPGLRAAADPDAALRVLTGALEAPLPRALLLPFRLALAPVFAHQAGAWLGALPGAAGLLGLHFLWVVRSDATFEEAAAEAGREKARLQEAIRAGRVRGTAARRPGPARPSPFPLAPTGEPAVALLWKNGTAFVRELRASTFVVAGGGGVALFLVLSWTGGSWRGGAAGMATICAVLAGGLALLGPLGFRYDLRRDLERIELLRTLPVSGPSLAAAEVGAAALSLLAVQAVLLAAAGVFLPWTDLPRQALPWVYGAGVGALVVAAPLNAVSFAIQNALTLQFPEWARIGRDAPGGVDHMGRSILTVAVSVLLLGAALLPVAFVAGIVALRLGPALGAWSGIPAALAGLGALTAEAVLLIHWLGERYDALEPDRAGLLP